MSETTAHPPDAGDREPATSALPDATRGGVPRLSRAERPTEIGRYRIVDYIGGGGMGDIWLGEDPYGNKVAIKQLSGSRSAQERFVRRFVREGQALSRLQHRNICRVYGIEEGGETPCIVMEYVEGVSLGKLLRYLATPTVVGEPHTNAAPDELGTIIEEAAKLEVEEDGVVVQRGADEPVSRVLPLQQSLSIVMKLCDAVQYAHERGIFHRDIKPSNVIVRRDGEPILLDFGVALLMDDTGSEDERLTATGQLFGTVDYMAPEQAQSGRDVDERADVYSIGAILYQMLTGHKHFVPSGNIYRDVTNLADHDPVSPRAYVRRMDRELEAIVLKALRPEPGERYRSARQLAEDLGHYQRGEHVSARRPTVARRLWRTARRHRTVLSAGLSLLLAAAVIGGYAGLRHYRRWGNWVPVFEQSWIDGGGSTEQCVFVNVNGDTTASWPVTRTGLAAKMGDWCWLRTVAVPGDVRLVVRARYTGVVDGLEMTVNAADDTVPFWYALPRGYSCQVGGYNGTMDFISVNTTPDVARLTRAVPSLPAREVTVELQRVGSTVELRVNGKRRLRVDQWMPFWGSEFARVGFRTYAEDVLVQEVAVYRRSLPQETDPLVVGEAFTAAGYYRDAVRAYSDVARDYAGSTLAARALAKAVLAAHELDAPEAGPVVDSLEAEFQRLYPESPLWQMVRERRMGALWREREFDKVLLMLPDHYRLFPQTRLALQLQWLSRGIDVPAAVQAPLIEWQVRTQGVRSIDASGLGEGVLARIGGSRLTHLRCSNSAIAGLGPLAGLRLRWLVCDRNTIADLTPLAGQPLKYLDCDYNNIESLDGLQDAPLAVLRAGHNRIRDLGPLSHCALADVKLNDNLITDISALRNPQLAQLDIGQNAVESVLPLKGTPLTTLAAPGNRITDLTPLGDTRIRSLDVSGNPADVSSLAGLALRELMVGRMGLSDLSFLKGMPLRRLNISGNDVSDISVLEGMSLTELDMAGNRIDSLASLRGMPLSILECSDNRIRSLEPLTGMPLEQLNCSANPLQSLEPFIDNPPAEFIFVGARIPREELLRAIAVWENRPQCSQLVSQARLSLMLQDGSPGDWRDIAAKHAGNRYLFVPLKVTFGEADSLARAAGGRLADLDTPSERRFVMALRPDGEAVWVPESTVRAEHASIDVAGGAEGTEAPLWRSRGPWTIRNGLQMWPDFARTSFVIEWGAEG